jgi:L-ascorbate metabolism protein UlaG (beta-lactamase superfamily)
MRITWFGHAAFRVEIADKIILIDPFFTGNPSYHGDVRQAAKGATHIVLSHGHDDHVGDTLAIAQATDAKVIANPELCEWLQARGLKSSDSMNTGGRLDQGGFSVSLVQAFHSSGVVVDGYSHYLGEPQGVILTPDNGPVLYHLGDTALFSDMKLINHLYKPDIGFVPIGDRFTMGARHAAYACREFFTFDVVIPCHYGSFPILEKSADHFVKYMQDLQSTRVLVPVIGEAFEV